jgi:hypothetical protein
MKPTFEELANGPVELYCEGCTSKFKGTAQEAFDLGWDCPPWFWSHITCPDCPISSTLWWELYSESKKKRGLDG